MEGVELEVTDDALRAIAKKAIARKTGARGLRSIVEDALLDAMFEVPARSDVGKVVVAADTIENGRPAELVVCPRKPVKKNQTQAQAENEQAAS